MRRSVIASSAILMLLVAASFTFIIPSADAEEEYGVRIFHDDGTAYTDGDVLINGPLSVNNRDGTYLIPANTVIPTNQSYITVNYPVESGCYVGFAVTGAEGFLLNTKVRAELYSDQARTSLLGTAVAGMTEDSVFFQLNDEKVEFQKNTPYYIKLFTSAYAESNVIPYEPSVDISFDAETEGIHKLSFDTDGGSPAPESRFLLEGAAYGELPTVTKTGNIFEGWYDGDTQVSAETTMGSEDVELKAHWTPAPTHTVTFDSNGGTPSTIPSRTVAEGDPIGELPTVTRTGYSFLGWHDGTGYVTKNTRMGTSDMNLTARWESSPGPGPGPGPVYKTFTLNYDANGGSGAPAAQTYSGTETSHMFTVSDTEPAWEGRAFQGWSTSQSGSATYHGGDRITVTGTTTLYAIWSQSGEHTLYFDANGGTCDETSRKLKEGEPYGALPEAQRDDYTFQGWFTSPSGGSEVSSATKMGNADVTVYAQWKFSGEEKEKHEERTLPDGTVVEKDTIDRIYSDGRTEHIEDTVTTHPDSSTEHTYMRILAEKDGSFIMKEDRSVSIDSSGKVTGISYDVTDYHDDGTVTISYDPSGSLDSVIQSEIIGEDAMGTALDRLREGGEYLSSYGVEYDSTVAAEIYSELRIGSGALSLLAEEEYGLYIIAEIGSMLLDDDVISSAASAMEDVTITMEKGTEDNLTPAQMRIVGDGFAVVVKMFRGSVQVHDIGGTATISLEPGLKENVFIYYIQEDGSYELTESSYDIETGEVRFTVTHFSVYFATSEAIEEDDGKGLSQYWWIIPIIVAAAIALVIVAKYGRSS